MYCPQCGNILNTAPELGELDAMKCVNCKVSYSVSSVQAKVPPHVMTEMAVLTLWRPQ